MVRAVVVVALLVACSDPSDDSVAVSFQFTGEGSGTIAVFQLGVGDVQFCTDDCVLRLPRGGMQHRVYAPSLPVDTQFGCDTCVVDDNGGLLFGPLEAEEAVTVRFTAASEAPLDFAIAGAFASDGDLVVLTHTLAAKVSLSGDVRWMTTVANRESTYDVARVRIAPTGDTYVSIASTIQHLDAAGAVTWSVPAYVASLEPLADGDLIVRTGQGTLDRVRRTDGSIAWSVAGPSTSNYTAALAVSPGGTIYVGRFDGQIFRHAATDGSEAGTAWTVPVSNPYELALAIDHQGALHVRTHRLLRLDTTTGSPIYDVAVPAEAPMPVAYMYQLPVGVTTTGTNQALHWASLSSISPQTTVRRSHGTQVAATDVTGTETWQQAIPSTGAAPMEGPDGSNVVSSGTCHASTCALFGKHMTPLFVTVP